MDIRRQRDHIRTIARQVLCAAITLGIVPGILPASSGGGVKVEGELVRVETRTLVARFELGILTSLIRKADGKELVRASTKHQQALSLIYPNQEVVPLGGEATDRFTPRQINGHRAEIRVEAWNGDGVIVISEDPETGDLIVEPGAYSSRPGVRACRWLLSGIAPELELIAPFYQGIRLPLEDLLIRNSRWIWPYRWEAAMAILQGGNGGFWIHCRDIRYQYKALQVGTRADARCLGFDTEAYGPIDNNLSAGGLAWRINVYEGDWRVPATRYRDWLGEAFNLKDDPRPVWTKDVTLALSWCPADPAVLEALAKKIAPQKVLLHVPIWRSDKYDQNYPVYTPSKEAGDFIKKAQAMGFHVMPHFNAIDMDPTHPTYNTLRDFQYRGLESKRVLGWTTKIELLGSTGEGAVPESNADRLRHRDNNTMVRIHPGLSMWRSILSENILSSVEALSLKAAFIDVTMNAHNVANCLVENRTPTEGMKRLTEDLRGLGGGLVLGGEGRNEITMQNQFFSQVHLFMSGSKSIEGLERIQPCPLGEFLFGQWSRSFGYSLLSGGTPDEEFRMKLHIALGTIPTIIIRSAEEIVRPNRAVKEMLALATR